MRSTRPDPWSIYIDIEGFGVLWEKRVQGFWPLGDLMRAIFRLGHHCYPREPDRLFAHQFGDAFLIVSDSHEDSLERCATVAVAIMRHVACSGGLVKAAISEGEISDIQLLYPEEVRDFLLSELTVSLGAGLMTINPVMGSALISAVGLHKDAPSGPLLIIDSSNSSRLGPFVPFTPIRGTEITSIDWVHMDSDLLTSLQMTAPFDAPTPDELEVILAAYCREQPVSDEWSSSVHEFLRVPL